MLWIQEQSDRLRFSPFSGILNCTDKEECNFVGDRVFAQIWSDKPGPIPTCEAWMPFGGLRDLSFSSDGVRLEGKISDGICIINGQEDGISSNCCGFPMRFSRYLAIAGIELTAVLHGGQSLATSDTCPVNALQVFLVSWQRGKRSVSSMPTA